MARFDRDQPNHTQHSSAKLAKSVPPPSLSLTEGESPSDAGGDPAGVPAPPGAPWPSTLIAEYRDALLAHEQARNVACDARIRHYRQPAAGHGVVAGGDRRRIPSQRQVPIPVSRPTLRRWGLFPRWRTCRMSSRRPHFQRRPLLPAHRPCYRCAADASSIPVANTSAVQIRLRIRACSAAEAEITPPAAVSSTPIGLGCQFRHRATGCASAADPGCQYAGLVASERNRQHLGMADAESCLRFLHGRHGELSDTGSVSRSSQSWAGLRGRYLLSRADECGALLPDAEG